MKAWNNLVRYHLQIPEAVEIERSESEAEWEIDPIIRDADPYTRILDLEADESSSFSVNQLSLPSVSFSVTNFLRLKHSETFE